MAGSFLFFTIVLRLLRAQVPEGWERNDSEISGRRKIVIYTNPKASGANAFVAYTPARGDFTSLGKL